MRTFLLALGLAGAVALAATPSLARMKGGADARFVIHAVQGNLAEVSMGQLAKDKGRSDGVRNFGGELATDHAAANDKLKPIADTLNVTAPTEPSKKQRAMHDRLAKLSGDAFDRAFVKAMVADHKKDIRDYEKEAKKQGDVAQYAKDTLPTLQKHLQRAEDLQKAGGPQASR